MKNVKKAVSLVLTLVMAMALLVVPTTSVSAAETTKKEWKTFDELVEEKGYVNGIQQPWLIQNSSGNDIGTSMIFNTKTNYTDEMYYELFRNCKAMGFDVVQLWITYQLGGILFDENWNVVGIEPEYKKNFPRVLEIAEECGVYLCLALIEHCESAFPAINRGGAYANVRYEEVYHFMHNEKGTELFVKNWLKPILEMTKKHENIIMANIFVEPESNGGRWDVGTGASWENVEKFMNTLNDTVHEVNPRLVTFSGASGNVNSTFDYYKNIDFDCYGFDYYSSGSIAHDTSELYLNKPLVYGEYGISDSEASLTKSDEFMTAYFGNYLETVAEQGVNAGFYWYYGFPNGNQGVIDEKSRPRSYTWAIRSWSLDREYARTGYEGIDAPAFMYSTSEGIRWYGSRGATKIMLQRSKNGTKDWKTVLSFDPETPESVEKYEFGAMMYEWVDPEVQEGETWYYRAIAADAEGNERISETISFTADIVTCSEEDNLIKNGGFEEGPLKIRNLQNGSYSDGADGWMVANQSNADFDLVHYRNGEDAHSGKGSVYRITRLFQPVDLKPNTDYTLTFYYKFDQVEGYWGVSIFFTTDYNYAAGSDPNGNINKLVGTIRPLDKNKKIGWVRHTVKFNSGDLPNTANNIDLYFYSWHGGAKQNDYSLIYDWYIDDVYLFETKK